MGITPIIGTGKEIGQLINGEDLVTGQKYGPDDYVWGTFIDYIWGYRELALDDTHALGLIERESKDMELFLKRKAEIDEFEAL